MPQPKQHRKPKGPERPCNSCQRIFQPTVELSQLCPDCWRSGGSIASPGYHKPYTQR